MHPLFAGTLRVFFQAFLLKNATVEFQANSSLKYFCRPQMTVPMRKNSFYYALRAMLKLNPKRTADDVISGGRILASTLELGSLRKSS